MTRETSAHEYRAVRRDDSVRLDDETLVWDQDAEELHRLNAAATLVWEALEDWSTVDAASARISGIAGLDRRAVRQCVEALYAAGLLARRIGPPGHPESSSSSAAN